MTDCPAPAQQPRREQILDAALELFAHHGLNNVTTRQIAQRVGISQPSLYAHFPNREAICAEVCLRAMDTLYVMLTTALDPLASLRTRIITLGRNYVQFGLNNEAAYRVAFMGDVTGDELPERDRVMGAGLRAYEVLYALAVEACGGESHDCALLAQSIWASIHGLVSLLLSCREFPWVDIDGFIDRHIDILADQLCRASVQQSGPSMRQI
ncbi:MAG: TetR/AcrR family transcriptional regulator [Alphaproteobacteria bacterium]|nr:TetR/AcrR family transcriptional regulator [Alphaproteobacteria bacterium]MDE2340460.1 TetR/AcrR family transcriptional regulator [Alphaproteobacteria bacterium]